MRALFVLLPGAVLLANCASQPAVLTPSEAETKACEARGGSIQPALALDAYVCLLPPEKRRLTR